MPERVVVLSTARFTPRLLEQLRAVDERLEVIQDRQAGPHASRVEVVYTWRTLPQPEEAPRLRWIQLHTAGADHLLDTPWLRRQGVRVTTASGIHAGPMAEYVLASLLAWQRRVPRMVRDQDRARWPSGRWGLYALPELRGATLGIVGYGSIGRQVAHLARAQGMRVLALKRSPERPAEEGYRPPDVPGDPEGAIPERFYGPAERLSMLGECDFVVVCLPLNRETRHFIGAPELRSLPDHAYLVNVARGGVLDEAALVRALDQGWIAGAGLDVYESEPLPRESPLWRREDVILSPHVAGFSLRYDERAVKLFAANLRRYLDGEPLYNEVRGELAY